jgi:hypothetical protein
MVFGMQPIIDDAVKKVSTKQTQAPAIPQQPVSPTYNPVPYSLTASNPYKESMAAFSPVDPMKTGTLRDMLSRGESAGLAAKNKAIQNLAQMGFGRSTFGEQIGAQAQAAARQPYIQSAIQASEAIKQQQVQNQMNMLQQALAGQQQNTQQQQFMAQFVENIRQADRNFEENKRQFGLQYALKQREIDMEQAKKGSGDLLATLAVVGSIIPGPWTPFAQAYTGYKAVDSATKQGQNTTQTQTN